jgi:hypothetical protein
MAHPVSLTKHYENNESLTLPKQNIPSPEKPSLQLHRNDPGVFVHVALSWQSSICKIHSRMSKKERMVELTDYKFRQQNQ